MPIVSATGLSVSSTDTYVADGYVDFDYILTIQSLAEVIYFAIRTADIYSQSYIEGTLAATANFDGSSISDSILSGILKADAAFTGSSISTTDVNAFITGYFNSRGYVSSSSDVVGTLIGLAELSGLSLSESVAVAYLRYKGLALYGYDHPEDDEVYPDNNTIKQIDNIIQTVSTLVDTNSKLSLSKVKRTRVKI